MNILFICKHNRFRSKVAEAFFKKYNKNKKNKAKSAGLIRGAPINSYQKKVCKEFNITIRNPPQGISYLLLKWADLIIIVADDVPKSVLKQYKRKVVSWKIKDEYTGEKKSIEKIILKIQKKIKSFLK